MSTRRVCGEEAGHRCLHLDVSGDLIESPLGMTAELVVVSSRPRSVMKIRCSPTAKVCALPESMASYTEPSKCSSWVRRVQRGVVSILGSGIRPIFVFDGHPPAMKYDCLKERRVQATKYKKTASSPAETSMPASEAPSRSVPMEIDIDRRLKRLVVHPPLLTHRASSVQCTRV